MSIYLLTAVLFWGFSYIAIKESLFYINPIELIAARFITGGLALYGIIRLKRLPIAMKGELGYLLITGLIVFAHFWIMATGLKETTAINSAWILTTAPVFIAVLSMIVLKERLRLAQGLGIIAAAIGVLILVSKGDFTSFGWISSTGDWLILSSCLTWAIYTIFTRRLTAKLNPIVVTFWTITLAGLIIIPLSLATNGINDYLEMPTTGIVAVLFLGFGCLAGAFWFWSEGLKKKPAAEVGLYLYLEPLFAMFGAAILLDEKIGWPTIIGGAFILISVYLAENYKCPKPVKLK